MVNWAVNDENYRKLTVHVPVEIYDEDDVDGQADKVNEISEALNEVVTEYITTETGTDVAATGEATVTAGWEPQGFSVAELAAIVDTLETALGDPDFIDTTSGGGVSEDLANEMRQDMRSARDTAQALLTRKSRSL